MNASASDPVAVWKQFCIEAGIVHLGSLAFDRKEKLLGRSGRGWNVDFHIRTTNRSSLVYVLRTGNRSAAHAISEHVVAAWYDLNQLVAGPEALR